MSKLKPANIQRLFNAAHYSWLGLCAAWHHERAFRDELWVLAALIPLALLLGDTPVERAVLVGCWIVVLIVELINSAIEAVVDRVGNEHHELAGRAKDLGSAAVFLSMILSVLVWLSVLM
jgi:diacylglycerol kinase (ATP)